MRRKQTILRSAASATLALGVMFSLVQCNEATGGTDTPSSSSSSVSTSRPDDDDDDDDNGGGSGGSESGSPLDEFGTVSGGTLTLNNSLTSENADELNAALKEDPSITSVDFSSVASIPAGVLNGTGVTTVTVPANAQVAEGAFSNTNSNSLTIAVTGSGLVTQTILGGASHVTLDLSKASLQSIVGSAFQGCTSLTSIDLPDSLERIGNSAFEGCTNLSSVTLPDSLETIGLHAFYDCTNLSSIDLPEGLQIIGDSTFYGCTNLSSVTLPGSLETIGSHAFFDCTSLSSIDLPGSLETIGSHAFYDCTSLSSVTLPGSLKTIGLFSFSGCDNLTRVDLSACTSLNSISIGAFSICDNLAYVTLPNTANLEIREGAFQAANEETELHLCIPNANMTVTINNDSAGFVGYAFTNRAVTLYYNGSNAETIKTALKNAGAKGTRENGEIEVKNTSDFSGPVSTGLSLFGLPF